MFWLSLLVFILLVELVVQITYGRLVLPVFETKPPFAVPAFSPEPASEVISFRTSDGVTLRGSLYRQAFRTPKGLILFCPELDGSHWSAASYAQGLLEEGYNVLSFDFRNQGESDSEEGYVPLHWATTRELEDVRGAMQFIQSVADLRSLPMGIMGISRGSMIALIAAAEFSELKAVCCEGAYSTDGLTVHYIWRWFSLYCPRILLPVMPAWHVRLTAKMARWMSQIKSGRQYVIVERWLPKLKQRPVMFIAGACDSYVDSSVSRLLADRINSTFVKYWLVPKARHNRARHADPSEYDRRICEFFDRALAPEAIATSADNVDVAATTDHCSTTTPAMAVTDKRKERPQLRPVA